MTLRDQVRAVVIAKVNEPYLKAAGLPRAAAYMCEKAFLEGWDRESLDARIISAFCSKLNEIGYVTDDEPGIDP